MLLCTLQGKFLGTLLHIRLKIRLAYGTSSKTEESLCAKAESLWRQWTHRNHLRGVWFAGALHLRVLSPRSIQFPLLTLVDFRCTNTSETGQFGEVGCSGKI